jgi:Ni/Co efflux regulator RcnB
MKNLLRLILCFLSLAGAMSGSQKAVDHAAKQTKAADPCKLLTGADIRDVQGDAVQETKPSTQPSGGLVMSQCLFRTANPSKSVSLSIASAGSTSPRAFWQKQFQFADSPSEEKKHEKTAAEHKQGKHEEDEESTRPRTIKALGEQAYWVGSPMVGALYVLKGDTFLRISVGGVREEAARIEKSMALARLALKRM